MKTLVALLLLSLNVKAYIMPTRIILDKTVDNSGSASYQIEKEIRFSNPEIPPLKETWQIENDRTMRLTVSPLNPTPGQVAPRYTALYVGGVKYTMSGTSKETTKISDEMTERLFHFRRLENMISYLAHMKILNSTSGNLDLARLNRSQGVVNFGIGRQTEEGYKGATPYIWIEQDAFVIRKLRYSDDTEITANQYQPYPKGLNYPLLMNLGWADQRVRMNTLSVTLVKKFPPTTFQSSQLENSRPFVDGFSRWNAVTEFYKRFR